MSSECTVVASTKRNPDLGGGQRGTAVAHLTRILITPLYPLSGQTVRTLALNSPREYKECFHVPLRGEALPDVVEGDILVIAGADYRVGPVSEWNDDDLPCLHLVVSEVKQRV